MPVTPQYTLCDHVSVTEVDDEVVLLNLNTGAYFGLNHVGADLMKALQNQQPIDQAVRQISDHYQMDLTQVQTDIDELLAQLLENNLLLKTK